MSVRPTVENGIDKVNPSMIKESRSLFKKLTNSYNRTDLNNRTVPEFVPTTSVQKMVLARIKFKQEVLSLDQKIEDKVRSMQEKNEDINLTSLFARLMKNKKEKTEESSLSI